MSFVLFRASVLFSTLLLVFLQPVSSSFIVPWYSAVSALTRFEEKTIDLFDTFFSPSSSSSSSVKSVDDRPRPVAAINQELDYPVCEYTKTTPYDLKNALPYQNDLLTINIASTECAAVYLNGVFVGNVKDWTSFKRFQVKCGMNDVVSISAMNLNGWHGLITDMYVKEKRYFTGGAGFKIRIDPNDPSSDWKYPGSRDACGEEWKTPAVMPRPEDDRFSKEFPYVEGAKYVWAPDAPPKGHIQLRFVFGNEDYCEDLNKNGQYTASTCPCREVTPEIPGACYEFNLPEYYDYFYTPKKCSLRDCAPKFECIPEMPEPETRTETGSGSGSDSGSGIGAGAGSISSPPTMCLRRYAKTAVHPKTPGILNGKCVQVKLTPPTPYYAPYS